MRIKVRINKRIGDYNVGDEVRIATDESGVPVESFWRRRLSDAERDDCVTILPLNKPKKTRKD